MVKKELYPWQEDCLKKWAKNQYRGMVQAVTGSGKTRLALEAAQRLEAACAKELRVKIVVPSRALQQQWKKALKCFLMETEAYQRCPEEVDTDIGMSGVSSAVNASAKYMIYIINSARYSLAKEILRDVKAGKAVFMIADECHHYDSERNRLIFEFMPYLDRKVHSFYSLGLSATLPRMQDKDYLCSVLGEKIYDYGMKEAAAANTICRYDIFHIDISFSETEREEYAELSEQLQGLYFYLLNKKLVLKNCSKKELFETLSVLVTHKDRRIAQNASRYLKLSRQRVSLVCLAAARISCVEELVSLLGRQEKIIIFCERIEQAEELYRQLEEREPGRVGRYHSKMGKQANQNSLERFRTGENRILIACKAVDEGMDIPDATVGIVLSGTSVTRQRIQRLGRVVRNAENKKRAALYYLHLSDSIEEQIFLPGETGVSELQYHSEGSVFARAGYDRFAEHLLDDLRKQNAEEELLREGKRVLDRGRVGNDWCLDVEDYKGNIGQGTEVGERNYWLCMRRINELRRKEG